MSWHVYLRMAPIPKPARSGILVIAAVVIAVVVAFAVLRPGFEDVTGDGLPDAVVTFDQASDTNDDGIGDNVDPRNGPPAGNDYDFDNDGIPDPDDPDDDNDGIPDISDPDDDNDGIQDISDPDDDNDGVLDTVDYGIPPTTLKGILALNARLDWVSGDDTEFTRAQPLSVYDITSGRELTGYIYTPQVKFDLNRVFVVVVSHLTILIEVSWKDPSDPVDGLDVHEVLSVDIPLNSIVIYSQITPSPTGGHSTDWKPLGSVVVVSANDIEDAILSRQTFSLRAGDTVWVTTKMAAEFQVYARLAEYPDLIGVSLGSRVLQVSWPTFALCWDYYETGACLSAGGGGGGGGGGGDCFGKPGPCDPMPMSILQLDNSIRTKYDNEDFPSTQDLLNWRG